MKLWDKERWNNRFRSVSTKMIVSYSILLVVFLSTLGYIAYVKSSTSMEADMRTHSSKVLGQTMLLMDEYFSNIENSIQTIAVNRDVIEAIKSYRGNSDYSNYMNKQRVVRLLKDVQVLKPDIYNIMIYNQEFHMSSMIPSVNLNSPFLQQVWKDTLNENQLEITYYGTHLTNYYYVPYIQERISLSYPIRDLNGFSTSNLAIYLVDVNFTKIGNIIDQSVLESGDLVLLVDHNNRPIYATSADTTQGIELINQEKYRNMIIEQQNGNFIDEVNGKKVLLNFKSSELNGWRLVYISELTTVQKNMHEMAKFTLYLILLCMVVSVFIASLLSRINTRPIINLVSYMREAGRGRFHLRIPEKRTSFEYRVLNNGFNAMLDRIEELMGDLYLEEIRKKEAEFQALQAKINPHFLYNTLQTIHSLAVMERSRDVERVTVAFGNLLHYTIYEKNDMVYLFKEIEYIKSYLEIQNIRYNDTIDVVLEIDEKVERSQIMKLILQPLVENAVFHGLENKKDRRLISIISTIEEKVLILEVSDNGIGMTEEKLAEINADLERYSESDIVREGRQGIGFLNVHERIRLKYGTPYGIKVLSRRYEGTKVQIHMPWEG
ncbi:sensor histidine kinase [Paenibacillus terrigena]|uniref:cache domain-containing sensor histidine kinase n=1 Tax=Paenibacillus terrigena TaxID=369333 RepID=UPI0028D7E28E|nr:sensor histidine kinase [Paenibacillus terrigena]